MRFKPVLVILVVCLVGIGGGALLSGCEMLVPGLKQARESFNASQAQYQETADALDKVAKELVDLKSQYDLAVASGDTTKAQALLSTGMAAASKYETLKSAAESSKRSYDLTKAELEKAESGGNYLAGVLGLIASAGTMVLGRWLGAKGPTAALGAVTETVEELKKGQPWSAVKDPLATKLSNLKVFNLVEKIRP